MSRPQELLTTKITDFNSNLMSDDELRQLFVENLDLLKTPFFDQSYPIHRFIETPTLQVAGKQRKAYDARIFKLFAEFDLLEQTDRNGRTALQYSEHYNYIELLPMLLENGAKVTARNKDGNTIIDRFLNDDRPDIVKMLLAKMSKEDFEAEISRRHSFLEYLLIDDRFSEVLQKHLGELFRLDEKGLDEFKKIALSKWMLGLAYSSTDFGMPKGGLSRLHEKMVQKLDFPLKADFEQIFCNCDEEAIYEYEAHFDLANQHKLKVVKPSTFNHATYMVFEYDANDKPVGFYYCDGNLPNNLKGKNPQYGYGACYFKVRKDFNELKFRNLASFQVLSSNDFNDINCLPNALDGVVEENSIAQAKKLILTQAQDRGNCPFKATNILLRLMLFQLYGMEFEEKDGKPSGAAVEAYKRYKASLIESSLSALFSFVTKENATAPFYPMCVETLQDVYTKSIVKGDAKIQEKIEKVFTENEIDFADIKNAALEKAQQKKLEEEAKIKAPTHDQMQQEIAPLVPDVKTTQTKVENVNEKHIASKTPKNTSCCVLS